MRPISLALLLLIAGPLYAQDARSKPDPGQTTIASRPAIDLVEAGKDTVWRGGIVLHVNKRDGASVGGIKIISVQKDGPQAGFKTTLTADTGTVAPFSYGDMDKNKFVQIILVNAKGTVEFLNEKGEKITGEPPLTKEHFMVLEKLP